MFQREVQVNNFRFLEKKNCYQMIKNVILEVYTVLGVTKFKFSYRNNSVFSVTCSYP